MKEYRIVFEKTGNARFISHLDLNRCMARAVRRSGLPAWYTEGFHPHMYLMFPLALSLGTESLCEVMDMRLTQETDPDEIRTRLNAAFPAGLRVTAVREPLHEAQEIGSAAYEVTLGASAALWEDFLAQEQIIVGKKTKKGMKEIDIRPAITQVQTRTEADRLVVSLHLPAGNEGNVNVSVVTDALGSFADRAIPVYRVLRTKIFLRTGEEFS